jgi:hypothetical protein
VALNPKPQICRPATPRISALGGRISERGHDGAASRQDQDKLIPSWGEIKNRYLVLTGLLRGSFLVGIASCGGSPSREIVLLIEQRRD